MDRLGLGRAIGTAPGGGQHASEHAEPEEVLRRIVRAVVEQQPAALGHDATTVLFQWNAPG